MKKYQKFLATVLIVIVCHVVLVAQTDSIAPFSLSLSIASDHIKSGADIHLKLTTTNTFKEPITLSKSNPSMEYEFDVRDAQNQPVSKTKYFKDLSDQTKPIVIRRLLKQMLKVGESADEEILISQYFELSQPGNYSIVIARRIPESLGNGIVKSNTLVVTVVP